MIRKLLLAILFACSASAPSAAESGHVQSTAGGTRAEGPGFSVEVKAPPEVPIGLASTVQVVLHPKDGFHVNKEFPTSLEITPPAGVDLAKNKQTAGDATKLGEDQAVFDVKFTGKSSGPKQFAAVFKFAVCTKTTCDPKREKLAWSVNVK